jgi:hypothetical protein
MYKHIRQLGILLTGALAIWLVNTPDPYTRFLGACVGLIGQPFWFYESYKYKQWGIFLGAFMYTAGWIMGIITYLKG